MLSELLKIFVSACNKLDKDFESSACGVEFFSVPSLFAFVVLSFV